MQKIFTTIKSKQQKNSSFFVALINLIILLFFFLLTPNYAVTAPVSTNIGVSNTIVVKNGLVGHWTFDGKNMTNTTALDISGNSNTGTLTNMTAWSGATIGRLGQALRFDGVDDYISVANNANLNGSQGTWLFWIKKGGTPSGNGYVSLGKTDVNGSYNGMNFYHFSSSIGIQIKGASDVGSYATTFGSLADSKWHHVAVSYISGGALRIYFDGSLVVSTTSPTFTISSQPLRFGRSVDTYWETYKGSIDDVRIYNRALSALEIQSLYKAGGGSVQVTGQKNGLVGHWTFDGVHTTANTTRDVSDSANNGTLINGPTKVVGKVGQALQFDGTNDYVNMTGTSSVQNVSYWIKPTANKYSISLAGVQRYFLNNGLYNGTGTSTRYINGVIPTSESLGSELITDGGAESGGTSYWSAYFNSGNSAAGSYSVSATAYSGTYSHSISISNDGAGADDVQFYDGNYNFSTTIGTLYKVQFAVRAGSSFTGARSGVLKNTTPWTHTGTEYVYDITTSWILHTYYFYAERTASDNRIDFYLGNIGTGTIYLDNISVKPVSSVGDVTNNVWNYVSVNLASPVTASAIRIGNIDSRYLSGTIDDVRFYNRQLSLSEILSTQKIGESVTAVSPVSNIGISSGLLGYWNFDGKNMTNTTALDVSGNGLTGTLTNMTTNGSAVIGKIGQGLKFVSASSTYISATNVGNVKTVSYWIKTNNQANGGIELNANQYITDNAIPEGMVNASVYVDGVLKNLYGSELVATGDMETDSGWSAYSGGYSQSASSYRGTYSRRMTSSGGYTGGQYLLSGIKTSTQYKLSSWQKWSSGVNIYTNFSADENANYVNAGLAQPTSWTYYSSYGTTGGTVTTPRVLILSQNGAASGYFDDVSLREVLTRYPVTETSGWHHVVITTDTPVSASAVKIGKGGSTYFNGSMDDVRIYNRVLSATEIQSLYKLGVR